MGGTYCVCLCLCMCVWVCVCLCMSGCVCLVWASIIWALLHTTGIADLHILYIHRWLSVENKESSLGRKHIIEHSTFSLELFWEGGDVCNTLWENLESCYFTSYHMAFIFTDMYFTECEFIQYITCQDYCNDTRVVSHLSSLILALYPLGKQELVCGWACISGEVGKGRGVICEYINSPRPPLLS
jgi:hypothetical protein